MGYEESKARLAEDLLTRRRAVASAAPVDATPLAYDPTPLAQLAPEPEAGYLRGTAASLVRGVAQIPFAGGNALEANPEADLTGGPRTLLNRVGTVVSDASERVRDSIQAPNYGKNEVKRSVFGGAESLPLSAAYMVPPVAGAVAGEALNPFGGGFVGSAAASAATYPIMQKSTYQETYEQIKKLEAAGQLKPGTTEADIVAAATKAGHYEAGPEAATNAIEGIIYGLVPGGKALGVAKSILGKSAAKQFGKNFLKSAAVEVPSEMVTGAGQQSAVNDITANPTAAPLQSAIDSIGPTLAMTTFTAGGGTAAQRFKAHLDAVAEKLDTPRGNPADPTPRAAALLAGVPATPADQITLPPGLPDLLGEQPDTIMDSENFTGQHATDLLARRKAAEARNAAAFDTANPVVPNAPDNTPVGNPYTQFAPAPAPAFEASGLDPKNTYVPQIIPELGPPPATGGNIDLGLPTPPAPAAAPASQFLPAPTSVGQEYDDWHALLATPGNEASRNLVTQAATDMLRAHPGEHVGSRIRQRVIDRYNELAGQAAAAPAAPVKTPAEAYAHFAGTVDNEEAPPAQVITDAYTHFSDGITGTRDPKFVVGLEVQADMRDEGRDPLAAENRTEFERRTMERYIRSTQTGGGTNEQVQGRGQEEVAPAASTSAAADYTQTTPDESHALFMERHAATPDMWIQAMNTRANRGESSDAHENRVSALARYDELLAERAAAAPQQAGQGIRPQPWMADREPITDQERESQQLAVDIIGSARWQEIRDEVRGEADAAYGGDSSGDVSTRATRREALRRAELEAANQQLAAPTNFTPEQYDTMNYGELNVEFNAREQQNPALANSCYAYAVDNSTPGSTQADRIRAALREFDFRQANPVANNPPNVLPTWADDNNALGFEHQSYAELRDNSALAAHFNSIRTEVELELVQAGENPADRSYAVAREIMRRFVAETTEAIPGTPYVSYQATDGTFSVADSTTDIVIGTNLATRADAADFGQLMANPSNPVPGTTQQPAAPGLSQAEQDAPRDVAAIVAGAPNHGTHEAFVEWVYGDNMSQQSVRTSVDDIYTGPLADRLSRLVSWPNSPAKTRLQILLTALQDEGYTSLSQVHTGHTPVRPAAPAPAPTYSPEVVASVTAPLTPEQAAGTTALKGLANRVALSLAEGTFFQAETRRLWKDALEGAYYAVANKVDRFRYGTSTATTLQGIQDDLNAHQRSIGSDLEVEIEPYSGGIKVRTRHTRGRNQWFQAVYSTPSGSGAMSDYSPNQREAGDGGAGYYAVHLVAKLMPQYRFQSSGMTQTNQNRRLEHAFSFLARYGAAGATGDVHIRARSGSGDVQIMDGESPLGATAARVLKRTLDIYPNLGKYTFNFRDGTVRDADNRRIPVAAIVAHARTNGALHDPTRHVSAPGAPRQGFSESTFLRALITQQILRVAKTDSRPGTRKMEAIMRAISANPGYSDLIFYNRTEGAKPKSDLQAPALQKALASITEALKGFIPINVIQTMSHLPGYHADMPAFNAAYHNGAIYVVADQVSSVAEAKRLVLDHELRHAGLRQVLGKGMDTFLKQAWYAQTDVIKGFANSKGIDTSTVEGRLEAAEEFIVSLAQEAKNHPLLDRAIAKIRSLLRAIGIDLNLSRSELRALVSRAGLLKESVGQDGATRFSRTDNATAQAPIDNTVAGFYRHARDKFKAMRNAARGAEWVTQMLMPIDRLIDLALLNTVYKPLHALLPVYTRLQREMQNIQDQIVGDAGRRFEKYEAACGTKAERDNFNSVMRDGTLWGIYPEGGKVTWTAEEWGVRPTGHESTWTEEQRTKWEATQAFKTGLSLQQAFTSLNDRYNSMTEAQRTQYHAAINDMEKLRTRYQKSMQDFVKKITPETTLENATRTEGVISLLGPDGRQYTTSRNRQGMWDLHSGDNRILKTAPELEEVAEGLAPQGKREKLLGKVNQKFKDIKGPYAPLSRFGNIVVNVYESTTDPTGEVSEDRTARYHFEKESDAQEMMARMRAEGFKVTIEEAAQSKSMRAQVPSEFITELDGAIERMGAGMEDEQRANLSAFGAQIREDMERIWLSMTPESSALKHTMKRTGLAGFDEDMMRGYVGYAQRHARGIAYLDRGVAIRETVKEMRTKIDEATDNSEDARASKRLVDHLENHEATVRGEKLSDLTQKLTRFPFLWYLSSPSVFLVQSSQPFIMTLPKLAVKFGYGKSLAAITRAYAMQANMKDQPFANKRLDAWHPTAELYVNRQAEGLETTSLTQGLSHDELTLLGMAIAVKRGQIDITMTHEAMNILKGNVKGVGDKITEKAAFLMQLSELMSRKAAFAATFEMEMERHGDFTKAVDNSVEVLRDTLYDYSRANRPGFMLGNAGRILFQFQIFRVHTLSKMLQLLVSSCTGDNKKAAIKEFSMMMGNTMAVAGISGLPFLSTMMGAFAFVFGDDDEPWDFDVYMRSLVGEGVVGDALLKGAPALFGMDVSRRVGMGGITDLFAGDPPAGVHGAQLYSYYAGKALGPLGGVASDVLFKAPELAKQGMWTELAEQTTPKPIKDLMTGYNTMFGEGKYTGKGKLLVDSADMTIWDSVLAMGGINPSKISNAQERNYNAQKLSSTISERRSVLQKQLQRAVISQDPDQIDAATDKIAEFNGKMPQFAITKQQIAAGVKRALRKEMGLEDKNLTKVKQKYEIGQGA